MISRTLLLGMLGLGLAACGSAPSPNWVAVEMSDPPGQFYIDLASTKTLDSGNKVVTIYIETPDNPDTSRAEASLELNCASDTVRVTKSIMVRRASGIRVDLTGYPTSDNWVNPNQVGFSDVYNYVCRNHGGTPPTSTNASAAMEALPEATESDVAASALLASDSSYGVVEAAAVASVNADTAEGLHPKCQMGDESACQAERELIPELQAAGFCMKEVSRYVVDWDYC